MTKRLRIPLLLFFMLLMHSCLTYGKDINQYSAYELLPGNYYTVDLDGDTIDEKLGFEASGDKFWLFGWYDWVEYPWTSFWVRGDGVHWETIAQSKSARRSHYWLVDFDVKDKYKEIMIVDPPDGVGGQTNINGCYIYRFLGNSQRFKLIYSPRDPNIIGLNHSITSIESTKNGSAIIKTKLYGNKKNNILSLDLIYTLKKRSLPNWKGDTYDLLLNTSKVYKVNSLQKKIKVKGKLFVYKSSSLKKNKLKTVLKKGYYKPLKVKFGKKFLSMQIKYGKKKGWIFVKRSNFIY